MSILYDLFFCTNGKIVLVHFVVQKYFLHLSQRENSSLNPIFFSPPDARKLQCVPKGIYEFSVVGKLFSK